ncbi:MAG: ATP-dependent DNA helicase [Candidatus Nanopelagicaceae bacterium]|nr:ATP-dependent DNA helicase [Candidatus Nanopelagicaceae bacterium]
MDLAQVRKALEVAVAAIDGKARTGQIEMAEAVANALIDQRHLMVQAGTGTGKSLAYLVPAIVSGKKTLIATATLALQRQLVERDLPKIVPALEKELGRDISYGLYKGVGNYICLQKLNSDEPDPDGELLLEVSSLEKDAKRLRAWAETPGVSGDRDEAPEVDRRVWAASSVSGRECVGADVCNFGAKCFAANAKAKAINSDIVVSNHTLLALEVVESHPILPERDLVILDEAHEFMDRTTQAVTEELTAPRVSRAAAMARKYKALPNKMVDSFMHASDDFADAMDGYGEIMRGDTEINRKLDVLPEELEKAVRRVRETADAIVKFLQADDDIIDTTELAERARVKGAVNEVNVTAQKLLKGKGGQVLWYEPSFKTLYLAPLSVSDVLRQNMLRQTPVIATSATLTVGRGFDSMAKQIGFLVGSDEDVEPEEGMIDPSNVQMLDVGSPFDFAQQGMLYLPKDLPEPGRDGIAPEVLEHLGELIDAAGGRTLALFSSWRAVEAADIHLRKVLAERPIRIITQKRGDAVAPLVEKFASDETSVLLGTMTLWQGVDVPGASCTVVAIDRIPFPRPDDPVMSARSAEVDAAGGSGFMSVSLPRAALLLAQGAGRLIRSVEDRGVVAILDSRIVTKRYGSVLLNSMPPLWRTNDGEVVRESLKRLAAALDPSK